MANENETKKVIELIKDMKITMLTTVSSSGSLHSRPMMTQETKLDGDMWFVTSKDSVKVDELHANNQINLAYSSPDNDTYVSISGTATLVDDKAKIDELWNPMMKAWFPNGKDDPKIVLLKVDPTVAEYWDSADHKIVQVVGFLKALVTGERYAGEGSDHGSVKL